MTPYLLYLNEAKTMGICEVPDSNLREAEKDLIEKGYVITEIIQKDEDYYLKISIY